MGKRILVCSNAYPPNFVGGAELIAHYHALAMQRRGHDVTIFAGDGSGETARYTVRDTRHDGLPVFRIGLQGDDFRIDYENFFHKDVEAHFARVLDHVKPDVIHFHNLIGLSLGMIHQAKERGIRTVMTVHDHWGFCLKSTLLRPDHSVCQNYSQCADCLAYVDNDIGKRIPVFMRREVFARSLEAIDFFISPSKYLADTYRRAGVPSEKMRVIGYGMDIQRFSLVARQPDPARTRFTFVGYLGEHKGLIVLLEAMAQLDKTPPVELNIVGTGHLETKLRDLVKQRGLDSIVRFTGKLSNDQIAQVLENTDALILPSVWPENQPVTILEAQACGIPVIGSRLGGIPELIEDGVTGYLFNPGDAADLAAKMKLFINDPAKIAKFGAQARQRLHETFETQAGEILQLYEKPLPHVTKQSRGPLVMCVGRAFLPPARQALEDYNAAEAVKGSQRVRFQMSEWVPRADWDEAVLVWATDASITFEEIQEGLSRGVAILVPQDNAALRDVCLSYDCGLFYKNAPEALACLRLLLDHSQPRQALGVRSQRGIVIAT